MKILTLYFSVTAVWFLRNPDILLLTSLYNNILLKILSADIEAAPNGEFTESHRRLRYAYWENYTASIAKELRSIIVQPFSTMEIIFVISETEILNSKERSNGLWLQRSFSKPSPGCDESTDQYKL
jgi:hypothetical protein